jgi:hypothetical protein
VVIMLILVVVLTIGLAAVTRTITNVREASTSERSSRAFSAAEAGVESILRQDLGALTQGSGQASVSLDLGSGKSQVTVFRNGGFGTEGMSYQPVKAVAKDDTIQINLANYVGPITLDWTLTNESSENASGASCGTATGPAALAITVIKDQSSNYEVQRYNYNPSNSSGCNNNFSVSGASTSPGFRSTTQLTITANTALMRITPIYNKATLRITPAPSLALPVQAYVIRSEGTNGDTKRVVEVEKSIGSLPTLFDYVIFNGSASVPLTKQ